MSGQTEGFRLSVEINGKRRDPVLDEECNVILLTVTYDCKGQSG